MNGFEREVRDMLTRRAADVPGRDGPRTSTRRSRRAVALVAVCAALLGLGVAAVRNADREPSELTTQPEPDPTATTPPTTSGSDAAEPPPDPVPAEPPATPDDWRALLPPGFVPDTAAALGHWPGDTDDPSAPADQAITRYLDSRLPDLLQMSPSGIAIEVIEESPTVTAHHVVFAVDDRWVGHVVITRRTAHGVEVVAAIADSVDVTGLQRDTEAIRGAISSSGADLLAADLLDPDGVPVPGSPFPDGVTGNEPIFGTAGSTRATVPGADRSMLELDVPISPTAAAPVTVRLRHVGGTWLSITEFALRPPSLDSLCSSDEPPHDIGLGEWFGGRQTGPAPGSLWPVLEGQLRHHAEGDFGTIEMLWPPSPEWFAQIEREVEARSHSVWRTDGNQTFDVAIGTGNDPCAWTQLVLTGDPTVMGWFADAITGIWGVLETTPDLGMLDPADLASVSGDGDTSEPDARGLVIGEVESSGGLVPIPATGSCDGAPDAPPQGGPVDRVVGPTAEAALAAFLATRPGDPSLMTSGYTKVTSGGTTIGFVIEGPTFPITTVQVEEIDGEWAVTRWEAAAC